MYFRYPKTAGQARQKNKVVSGPRAHHFQAAHHNFFLFSGKKVFLIFFDLHALQNTEVFSTYQYHHRKKHIKYLLTPNVERGAFELYIRSASLVFLIIILSFYWAQGQEVFSYDREQRYQKYSNKQIELETDCLFLLVVFFCLSFYRYFLSF